MIDQFSDPDIQGGFYTGLYQLDTAIPFVCPTGNCTWARMTSLGVCHKCEDVTDKDEPKCHPDERTKSNVCHYKTPSGIDLKTTTPDSENDNENDVERTVIVIHIRTSQSRAIPVMLGSLMLPRNSDGKESNAARIHDCSLDWCAQVYPNITVTNGSLKQLPPPKSHSLPKSKWALTKDALLSQTLSSNVDFPETKQFTVR